MIFLFSCSKRGENTIVMLEKSGENVFALDEETSAFNQALQVIEEDGIELVVFLNKLNNHLYKYDLSSGELIQKLPFTIEGPNGVGNLRNFFYHNRDSIFFSQDNATDIFISNESNNRTYKIRTGRFNKDTRGRMPHVSEYAPILFNDGKINLISPFVFSPYANNAPEEFKDIERSFFIYEYDLNNDSTVQVDLTFPIEYKDNIYSPYYYLISQTHKPMEKEIIYSFFLSDSLIIYNTDNKSYRSVSAISQSAYPKKPLTTAKSSLPDNINSISYNSFISSLNYGKILYDPYQKLYYRFVEYPVSDHMKNEEISSRIKQIGIIVIDENFKFLGEYSLGYGKYITSMAFVSKEGLNIFNYEKNFIDESNMVFDIFKF